MKKGKRRITYAASINEALDQSLARDRRVVLIGEGVPDPRGIFGTTKGLREKHGERRVFDMPVSENGVTGICIGAAISGLRPVMTHQRVDFSLLSFDQIVNNAAKWFCMFGGLKQVPLVIRMIIGRGWGQGAQHSQALQALFAHIPGLKVIMPYSPYDAKGMLIAAIEDDGPVIFIEHRWLHNIVGPVPERYYKTDITKSKTITSGRDVTVVSSSYMTLEAVKCEEFLRLEGIEIEVIDLRSIKPLDIDPVMRSVKKTGKLLVADTGHQAFGVASEVIASVCEEALLDLKMAPVKVALPDSPTPTSWKLAEKYYPTYLNMMEKILTMLKRSRLEVEVILEKYSPQVDTRSDVPDASFTGPF